jgi:site-specific DNA recombinase
MPRAVLCARVSSKDQAETGYSLQDQIRTLRAYAEANGYEAVEEVEDAGYSGASLERPGLNRVRELVGDGGISIVLAQDRDRIARNPTITRWLQMQFEQYGTELRAINDPEDESATGQLTVGILDQVAKFERAMITQRTRRGRFQRAREGKVIVSGSPPYGFRYTADRTNYVVDPTMATVRRIFVMVAAGNTLHSIKKTFEKEGVPTLGGQKLWLAPSMRRTILNDAYHPHDHDALEELVSRGHLSPQVLANLDASNNYGVWWYGVNRVELIPMGEHRRRWSKNPESERVAVPVPDAGIPRETVDAARDALKRSCRPRKESKHFYELRGMLRCTCCGLLMTGYSTGSGYRYYQCQSRNKHGKDDYPNGATRRADDIERDVMCYVQVLISDREKLRAQIDEAIARKTAGLRDPDAECAALEQQIDRVFKLRSAYQDQQAAGLMTLEELSQKLRQLENQRSQRKIILRSYAGGRVRLSILGPKRGRCWKPMATACSLAYTSLRPR